MNISSNILSKNKIFKKIQFVNTYVYSLHGDQFEKLQK